jgi:hypothetical protein
MAGTVRLYPQVGPMRRQVIVRDVGCLLLVVLFAFCGVRTYRAVDDLIVLGTAVSDTGHSVQNGFGQVAQAVQQVPLVGGSLSQAISSAGSGTGGRLATLGSDGAARIHQLALLLGWLVFGLPTLVLAVAVLPRRVRQVRTLSAADRALAGRADPAVQRLLASRAVFGLPYQVLLSYTADPFGDLVAGRYDALVAAELAASGLRSPPASAPAGSPAG